MLQYSPILHKILLGLEFIAALVAFIYVFKLKNSYWKWFSIYLIFIFFQEFFWFYNKSLIRVTKQEYYTFIGIPIQYLFFLWLYAYKSIQNKKLFIWFISIYSSTFLLISSYYKNIDLVYPLNLTVGTLLLTILIILEFKKQIISDDILKFKKNKMFYINIGVILFYVGTYPFFTFSNILIKEQYINIYNGYYFYFLISNYIMYLLFIASFIWGKHQS